MGLDFNGFWFCKFLPDFYESQDWSKIDRINNYIIFSDDLANDLNYFYKAVIENNRIYTEVCFEQKIKVDDNLRKKGFYTIDYLDKLNRYHTVKLSLYDCTFWLIMKYFDKCPDDLFSSNLNFFFANKETQQFVTNLFNYIWYVKYFIKKNNQYGYTTKLDFSNPRFLKSLNSSNFFEIILGNSYDLVSWFFYVDVSNIEVNKLTADEDYIKYIISLQRSFKLLLEVNDYSICFEAYKDILINLVKLSEFTRDHFFFLKYNDATLKTWNEWYDDELDRLKKLLKFFKKD